MIKINSKWKFLTSIMVSILMISFVGANYKLFYVVSSGERHFTSFQFILSILYSVLIFVLGGMKLQLGAKSSKVFSIVAYVLGILASMNISIVFSGGYSGGLYLYIINIAFYLVFSGLGLMISGSPSVSALVGILVSYIYNAISFIIYCFRGSPLMPTDFLAISTAMGVASEYKFNLKYQIITATIMAIAHIMMIFKFPIKLHLKKKRWIIHLSGLLITVLSALFVVNVDYSVYDVSVFDQKYANFAHGSAVGFYVNATKMGLDASEGYDPKNVDESLLQYDDIYSLSEDAPNIIVIMNESFADLRVINDFDTNIEYMPYFNSLKKNTIKGQMLVSPFGGYTCNSEYEFLTGMNTGLLDSQSIPYMHMISNNMPYTLNTHMKHLGYTTTAIHPYYAKGWNRNIVYDYMGFDKFISIEDFYELNDKNEYIRKYISDECNYRMVLDNLYSKEEGEKKFIFNITMQNHGGYEYEDFEPDVLLENMNGKYPKTEQYLSCIRQSDMALEKLLEELRDYSEPVIVAMFGDHQPSVEEEFFEELYGADLDDLDDETLERRYITPFMIWANFDIKEAENVKSSPCFLSNMIMETAKLPKSRVQMYLDDLQTQLSQLNPLGYYDTEGVWHKHEDCDELGNYYDLQFSLLNGEDLNYDFAIYHQQYDVLDNYVITPFYKFRDESEAIISEYKTK